MCRSGYQELIDQGWRPARIYIAAEHKYGSEVLGRLYTELGNRFHREKAPRDGAAGL